MGAQGQGYSQSVDLIKNGRGRWNREGEQQVTLDPMNSYKKKVKMEVEGVPRCIASNRVGRNDRLGGGCETKESLEIGRG